MNVFDAEMKVFNTEVFLQHNITDLNFVKTFQCFAQSGKALMVERHKHTHTHTHTHTRMQLQKYTMYAKNTFGNYNVTYYGKTYRHFFTRAADQKFN